ncbi:MAG: tRNA (adenosine(37)-N6)-threonylcarbamoyltransferase complex ATPase subunit type 1 TsaE [Chloroflexi bacterium]|nr:MAG: tRNA (adenosine(37)-N6)-threonylcarbamoyltransferase complex ATPase subunit type 1 TsaE [Chloroflexota bacterium]
MAVVVSRSERETLDLGRAVGGALERGDLIGLAGPLGAGKTVLVRGIAWGVGADPAAVRSPTFVLHHVYTGGRITLHHLDLYRLGSGTDIAFLDLEHQLESGAVLVEWGDHADLSPLRSMPVGFEIARDDSRVITLDSAAAPDRVRRAWRIGTPRT